MLHAHDSIEAVQLRFFLGYKNKLVLTPHRPEPLDEEMASRFAVQGRRYRLCRLFYRHIERLSYRVSDAFIFPSLQSKIIYMRFPGFAKESKGKPVGYVVTGCREKTITKSRAQFRLENNIPESAFVVAFVGRHNYIKGYDFLLSQKKWFKERGITVVCAGGSEPGVDDGWIELGYVPDPQNVIAAADLLLVPNKNTYFDLIVIEGLSLGQVILTTPTGGNIDLQQSCAGILLHEAENEQEFRSQIEHIVRLSTEQLRELKNSNALFYSSHCSLPMFARTYISVLNSLFE